jgi:hypothetical protein
MKTIKNKLPRLLPALAGLVLTIGCLHAADLDVRTPVLDEQGRFWVYRNGPTHPPMPFAPYGWMSDTTNLTHLLSVDLNCHDQPNTKVSSDPSTEVERCIDMRINWADATWASVAFISGPSKPPWWGETRRGRYFNLSDLPHKKLVFYARGKRGGEVIQAQFGALGAKPFGDSLPSPITSEELKLTSDWVRYEIIMKDIPAAGLAHICNGFGVVAERASQTGAADETEFYLDDIYFE